MNFINLNAQYKIIEEKVNKNILSVFQSGAFIGGSFVAELEEKLAAYTGSKHCISCASGTDAIILSLMAGGIKAGDEVITTPFTFIASAEVISLIGAVPVFVDIEEGSYNIDANKIKAAITEKTKAIVAVSLFGQCADMDAINAVADEHGLLVIEDAAQSFGAEYKGRKSCALSKLGTTSFYPSKPLGAYGDGGAVFTDDDELDRLLRILKNHGQSGRYVHEYIGMNSRLDAVQAAILLTKFELFDDELKKREEAAALYAELLGDLDISLPTINKDRKSVYAQYSVRVKDRDGFAKRMKDEGIPTAIHYPIPLNKQKVYSKYSSTKMPVAEKVSSEIISLPFSPYISKDEQKQVAQAAAKSLISS